MNLEAPNPVGSTANVAAATAPARRTGWYQRKRTREAMLVACFLLPSLAIFLLYRILPLAWNVVLSFEYWSPLKAARFAGLDNYAEMFFEDDVFWQALTQHADLHPGLADRDPARARRRARGQQRSQGRRHLPHHHLPELSLDERRGRHRLALAL